MKPSELLDKPEKWTKTVSARDIHDMSCHPLYDHATCFCVLGALQKCIADYDERYAAIVNLQIHLGVGVLSFWNDAPERTYEEVIAALKACDL